MRITYVALKRLKGHDKGPGELIPEAASWKERQRVHSIAAAQIMPVLVETLPVSAQEKYLDYVASIAIPDSIPEPVVASVVTPVPVVSSETPPEPVVSVEESDPEVTAEDSSETERPKQHEAVGAWRKWASQYYDDAESMTKSELMKLGV